MRVDYRKVRKVNGYASKREANRAGELALLLRLGKITDLREQVPLELVPKQKGERAITWVADFVYRDLETGEEVWEDCKGFRTPLYIVKRKLALYLRGVTIRET